MQRIGNLVMILGENDKRGSGFIGNNCATWLLLPLIALTLIKKPALNRREPFLRSPAVIRIVRFPSSGEGNPRGMMKIIVPHPIKSIPTLGYRGRTRNILGFILRNKDKRSWTRDRTGTL